jgi:hypothetical protein
MDKWRGRESEANVRVVEVEKIDESTGGDECEETHASVQNETMAHAWVCGGIGSRMRLADGDLQLTSCTLNASRDRLQGGACQASHSPPLCIATHPRAESDEINDRIERECVF